LNSEQGLTALDYYIRLAREAGIPRRRRMDQAEVIQNMVTGKTAHIMMVIAAWSQMDDPTKSAVVDKVEFAPRPHAPGLPTAPGLGHGWAAWPRTFRTIASAPPSSSCAGTRPRRRRWRPRAPAASRSAPRSIASRSPRSAVSLDEGDRRLAAARREHAQFPRSGEVIPILELGLNQAIAGETKPAAALNGMADQIHAVMAKYKYNTGTLPKLN
jgi:multiple sugar transport system substrate-binding protein